MKVLVTGGRNYADRSFLSEALDKLHAESKIELLIQGGASGADALSQTWAITRCVPCLRHPADWEKLGRGAGPIRNKAMLEWKPDLVLAFPGGSGTANMVEQAKKAGVRVMDLRKSPVMVAQGDVFGDSGQNPSAAIDVNH